MSHHPPPPPHLLPAATAQPYGSKSVRANPTMRYGKPPYMGQASLGLSGHNQYKAPYLQTRVPSASVLHPPFTSVDVTADDPIVSESLYNYSNYGGGSDSGGSDSGSGGGGYNGGGDSGGGGGGYNGGGGGSDGDWKHFSGPHVIRNNDLQYHYAEPFGFKQFIINSLNRTSTDNPSNPDADFTVQVGTAQGSVLTPAAQSVTSNAVILNDVTIPKGQYLIEDEWSRIDFSEGIVIYPDFREIVVTFPNVYSNGHGVRIRGVLPLRVNDVKSITFYSEKQFKIVTAEEHSSNMQAVQDFWKNDFALKSFSATESGILPLGPDEAVIKTLSPTELLITLKNTTVDTSSANEFCGVLTTTSIPSPYHLALVANAMFNDNIINPVRHDGTSVVDPFDFDTDPHPQYVIPNFSLNFKWNADIDSFQVSYSITTDFEGEQPQLSGPIIAYMGFANPLTIPNFEDDSTSITVRAQSQRQKDALSGTRIASGNYATAKELAKAMEQSMNGTWFGGQGEDIDDLDSTNFHIYFIDQNLVQRTLCVPVGRYTPCELALKINESLFLGLVYDTGIGSCTTVGTIPILAVPVFDDTGIVYKGIKFVSTTEPVAFPFSIDFQITAAEDPKAIDPRRFGYRFEFYRGKTVYSPRDEVPYYPVIVQGGQQEIFRSLQLYTVEVDELTEKFEIVTHPFNFRRVFSFGYLGGRTASLQMNVGHGMPVGQHVYLHFRYSATETAVVSAFVLEGEPFDISCGSSSSEFCETCTRVPLKLRGSNNPTVLNVCFGGTNPNPFVNPFGGDPEVVVEFTNENIWTLDATYGVVDCIRREVLGLNNIYYSFINEGSTFAIPINIKGFLFTTDTTFIFPNSYQLYPYKYVLIKITINATQGEGETEAIATDSSAGRFTSLGANNFIARIPLGRDADTAHFDLDANIFNIQHIAINKLNMVHVQVFNPDGTYYNFHGKPMSVGLVFNLVRAAVP